MYPRKLPKQGRSQATVEAITQAAAYILIEQGWEQLTTNAIAQRAGVNIGSLYQYFPNKEAIVAELQREHASQTLRILKETLSRLTSQPSLQDAIRLLVEAIVLEHRAAPEVHRAIAEELPDSVKCEAEKQNIEDALLQALKHLMINVPDPQLAVRMTVIATHAVIHEAALYRPEMMDHPDFTEELVALLLPYLQRI